MDWLRRLWRALLRYLTGEEQSPPIYAEAAERELAALRTVAALSVAQAQRAELELREALADASAAPSTLGDLMLRLTELRDRARRDVAAYHEHQRSLAEALERLGQATRAAAVNRQRDDTRRLFARSQAAVDAEALQAIEDEARAEAARLEVLQQLDAGQTPALHRPEPAFSGDLRLRAQALLEESALGDLLDDRG